MPCLDVKPVTDAAAVDAIYADPWVSGKIDPRTAYAEHPSLAYYGAYVDGDLLGVFLSFRFSDIEREIHAALIREAVPFGRELGALFLDRIFAEPEVLRVTAQIIGNLTSAANYCRKLGFSLEGTRRSACVQNNRVMDVITLGLLKSEWTERRA